MKNCLLLSLLCAFVTHMALAKVWIPSDNTFVSRNLKLLPPTQQSDKAVPFFRSSPSQHFSLPSSTLALSSTMVSKEEIEPNNDIATANPLGGKDVKIKGNITPGSDIDVFSFTANAGDRVYAATQTFFSSTGSYDSVLEIIGSNGITVLESDDDDGTFGPNSSSIAGTPIQTSGTYYIKVRHKQDDRRLLPYFLYFRLQSGTPTAEKEPNNSLATATTIPNSGWVSGNLSSGSDLDYYAIQLNAGETIFVSLDFNPERDNTTWNGLIAFGEFMNLYFQTDDPNTQSPNSEGFFLTVKSTGTYYIAIVSSNGSFGTYQMSVSTLSPTTANVTSYNSSGFTEIPSTTGSYSSTINIPVNKRIESLKVSINLIYSNIANLDVRLRSPSGNTVILFTDISALSPMDIKLDDNAALPLGTFPIVNNVVYQPPKEYRLEWFKGQLSSGIWTLIIDVDTPGGEGKLNSWSIDIEEQLPITGTITSIYSNDFELNDGGFIHSGTQDEWERGTPSFAPINTANSGTKCWKTDLDNTYNFESNSDLVSPNIYIPVLSSNDAYLSWAQKYQFAGAYTDNINAYVEIQEVGTSNTKKVWQWLGSSMVDFTYGSPNYRVDESAGWGINRVKINEFSGKTIRIIFHFGSSNTSTRLAGWAIDDVNVFKTFCPGTQNVTTNYTGVYTKVVTSTTITATNQIRADIPTQSVANVVYQAGNAIILSPNFKAEATGGAVFIAQIGSCN